MLNGAKPSVKQRPVCQRRCLESGQSDRVGQCSGQDQRRRAAAASSLAAGDVYERVLTDEETEVLLRLLTAAMSARVPTVGRVTDSSATDSGVKLIVSDGAGYSAVRTRRGVLHLGDQRVRVEPL